MPFVKLDCRLLDSSLWGDRDARDLFLTCLLLAVPWENDKLATCVNLSGEPDGWELSPGFYGLVDLSRSALAARAQIGIDAATSALLRLMSPDFDSRSQLWNGRRLTRVLGKGYVVLNYDVYRSRDYNGAERARRWRERHKHRDGNVS